MSSQVTLERLTEWSEQNRADLQELAQAVYPPGQSGDWPGRHLEWSPAEWGIRVTDENGRLVSYTGVHVREAELDDQPVRIGGIGGVKTHPDVRRRGYGAAGISRASEFFRNDPAVAFALLVCESRLLAYYSRLGWREFHGQLLTRQNGRAEEFTFNRVMLLDIGFSAPQDGTIDLLGPPW